MPDYVKQLRSLVGHRPIILNSASGALLNDYQQVLLQERTDTGNWGFPGGYLEYKESYAAAVIREFKEDAGVSVVPSQLLKLSDTFQYEYLNGDQVQPINCFYLVKYVSGELLKIQTDETTRLKYFNLDRPPVFFNRQHAEMFQILRERIQGYESGGE